MAMKQVRKNFNVFVDGVGHAGECDDWQAPKVSIKTEEFRGGGMLSSTEIPMGLDTLTASFSMLKFDEDVLSRVDLASGDIGFTVREALEDSDGTVTQVKHVMRGRVKSYDPGTQKAGSLAPVSFTLALNYYRLEVAGAVVQEIDVVNMVYVVNGVDEFAAQRTALGM
jgi:P2 family phage contractile tail tube protein